MYNIEQINNKHIDEVTKMFIELKQENFLLNSTAFNSKRKKLKPFNEIKSNILSKYKNDHFGYLLTKENEAVGFIFGYIYLDEMENDIYENLRYKIGAINNLYLKKNHRKKGYGKKLMEKMNIDFKNHGCEILELTTNPNSMGEKFYKKLGFEDSALFLSKKI